MAESKANIRLPRYQTVAVEIAQRIVEGKYREGDRLKSRSTLASTFKVSPETARKAINVLADLDIVEVRQGSGVTVISEQKATQFLAQYDVTAALSDTKQALKISLQRQKEELEQLNELVEYYFSQVSLSRSNLKWEPFELKITSENDCTNKTLSELNLWHQTGATVIALKRQGDVVLSPGPYATIQKGDILYFVGDELSNIRMTKLFQPD